MEPSPRRQRPPVLIVLAILIASGGLALATMQQWMPIIEQLRSGGSAATEADAGTQAFADPNSLRLSPQARQTLDIRVERLAREDYDRSVRIPGQVVKIPGLTDHEITAKSSGTISKVHILQGQIVEPGAPLFTVRLTHEDAISVQLKLLEALAKIEVIDAEIERLEELERASPGAVAGKRILQQRYELGLQKHTVASHRQALLLLGLPEKEVMSLSGQHRKVHSDAGDAGTDEQTPSDAPLLDKVTIYAPQADAPSHESAPTFVVENLAVNPGQHVNIGDLLCRLVDYRRLYIEGHAFERDLEVIRRAMEKRWTADVAVQQRGDVPAMHESWQILYVDPEIDVESRSASFYVELVNKMQSQRKHQGRPYADWQFRPGQRVELRVPVERFENALVVSVNAVAREGLDNYVFQVSGDIFVRRPVTVRYRDEQVVVLSDENDILEGASLATSGAYQLQLSLLNRTDGPTQHSHGGAAHSH